MYNGAKIGASSVAKLLVLNRHRVLKEGPATCVWTFCQFKAQPFIRKLKLKAPRSSILSSILFKKTDSVTAPTRSPARLFFSFKFSSSIIIYSFLSFAAPPLNEKMCLSASCVHLFFRMGLSRPLFVYFRSFHMTNIAQILQMGKTYMVCLWLEPGAADW